MAKSDIEIKLFFDTKLAIEGFTKIIEASDELAAVILKFSENMKKMRESIEKLPTKED